MLRFGIAKVLHFGYYKGVEEKKTSLRPGYRAKETAMVTPLIAFDFGSSGMMRCPCCKDELVDLPEASFADTEVCLQYCFACKYNTGIHSVMVEKSALAYYLD